MKIRPTTILLPGILALPALGQTSAQQVPPSVRRAMMSTAPIGLQVTDAGPELLIADPSQGGTAPAPWSTARFGATASDYPDYSLDALFGSLASDIRLSAFSTGNDLMPAVTSGGELVMDNIWFGLSVSVTNNSIGAAGSHIERLRNAGDVPGSEVFTYYAVNSTGIDPTLVNTTISERSRESLGLPVTMPQTQGVDTEIDGLDFGLGIIPFDPNANSGVMFGNRQHFFFALHPGCVADLPDPFAVDSFGTPVPADAGTIYSLYWTTQGANPTPAWSPTPTVYRDRTTLELASGEWVDALAVSQNSGQIIFSTPPSPSHGQLMVHRQQWTTPPVELRGNDGTKVTDHLGLGGSDVDGTCGIDPESTSALNAAIGTPEFNFDPNSNPLGISVIRTKQGSVGMDMAHIHVTGMTEASPGSICTLYIYAGSLSESPGNGPSTAPGDWLSLGTKSAGMGTDDPLWSFPTPVGSGEIALAAMFVSSDDLVVVRESWVSRIKWNN